MEPIEITSDNISKKPIELNTILYNDEDILKLDKWIINQNFGTDDMTPREYFDSHLAGHDLYPICIDISSDGEVTSEDIEEDEYIYLYINTQNKRWKCDYSLISIDDICAGKYDGYIKGYDEPVDPDEPVYLNCAD